MADLNPFPGWCSEPDCFAQPAPHIEQPGPLALLFVGMTRLAQWIAKEQRQADRLLGLPPPAPPSKGTAMIAHPMSAERVIAEFMQCRDAGHMLTPAFITGERHPVNLTCQEPTCGRATDHPQMMLLVENRGNNAAVIHWPDQTRGGK